MDTLVSLLENSKAWVTLSFLAFLFGFFKYAVPGILKSLDARSDAIKDELAEAVQLRESAQTLLADFKQKQKEMQAEAQAVLKAAKAEALAIHKQAEADVRASTERRTKMAHDKIARAEADALADIQSLMVDLSVESTRHLLQAELKDAQHSALNDNALKEIKRLIK